MSSADLPEVQRTATPVRGTRVVGVDGAGRDLTVTVRGPRSQKGKRRARTGRKHTILKVVGATVLALAMVTGLGTVYFYRHLSGNLTVSDAFDQQKFKAKDPFPPGPHRPTNILVMGEDSRDCSGCDIDGLTGQGARSDTTILVHLSADKSHAYGVSIPRDSMVDRPECETNSGGTSPAVSNQMWNAAFSIGGPACTISQVEYTTGVHIDHFVVVDFASFKGMVDAIGGVKVCLTQPVNDPLAQLNLPAGEQTLTGNDALGFVRERHAIGDGSDLGRVQRQQAFISSMVASAMSAGTLANPVKLVRFLDSATKGLTVDPGLGDMDKLASLGYDFRDIGLNKIQFLTVPWEYDPSDPNRVVWKPEAAAVWKAIKYDKPLSKDMTSTAINAEDSPGAKQHKKPASTSKPSSSSRPSSSSSSGSNSETQSQLQQAGLCS
jgi:LCP family protein required for cell wall assembly